MMKSAQLGRLYAHWNDRANPIYRKNYFKDRFPLLDLDLSRSTTKSNERKVAALFVTESMILESIVHTLDQVSAQDEVRIQMFYLSFQPVLDAIVKASTVSKHPVRLLLDANKDSFNREKDGTPNRQVAQFLRDEAARLGGRIEIRWYSTHGEQNHAKTMSVTSKSNQKHILTTGSCNWTGRNMDGVNMESNIVLLGAKQATEEFNRLFDLFWSNSDGNEYSLDYKAFQEAASDWKWKRGEKPFYWSSF